MKRLLLTLAMLITFLFPFNAYASSTQGQGNFTVYDQNGNDVSSWYSASFTVNQSGNPIKIAKLINTEPYNGRYITYINNFQLRTGVCYVSDLYGGNAASGTGYLYVDIYKNGVYIGTMSDLIAYNNKNATYDYFNASYDLGRNALSPGEYLEFYVRPFIWNTQYNYPTKPLEIKLMENRYNWIKDDSTITLTDAGDMAAPLAKEASDNAAAAKASADSAKISADTASNRAQTAINQTIDAGISAASWAHQSYDKANLASQDTTYIRSLQQNIYSSPPYKK